MASPKSYSENALLRPTTVQLPLYSFSFTVPVTHCWVWAMKASKASFSGENHRPLYTWSAQACSMPSLWCSTPRSRQRSSKALWALMRVRAAGAS